MLLTRQRRGPPSPGLNMTPMIDVVFQLLIFFMCTSVFNPPEHTLPTQLPQSGAAARPADDFDPVVLRLARAGSGVLVTCDAQPMASFAQLIGSLKRRRAVADVQVVIEGEGAVPFGDMVAALDACYQADLWRVAFSPKGVDE